MLVSFDFDTTLKTCLGNANTKICNALRTHKENGDKVFIISSRENTKENMEEIFAFLAVHKLFIPAWNIFLEDSDEGKVDKILEQRIDMHFDDCEDVLEALKTTNCVAVDANTRKAKADFQEWLIGSCP